MHLAFIQNQLNINMPMIFVHAKPEQITILLCRFLDYGFMYFSGA